MSVDLKVKVHIDGTLTPNQQVIYEIILDTWRDHGFAPSQAEIRQGAGCGPDTVRKALIRLQQRNYIVWQRFSNRAVKPTDLNMFIARSPEEARQYEDEPFLAKAPPNSSKLQWERQDIDDEHPIERVP